jgi:hypothetical protein
VHGVRFASLVRELQRAWRGARVRKFFSLDVVITSAYYRAMTASELRRKLAKARCTFEDRKKHTRVFY